MTFRPRYIILLALCLIVAGCGAPAPIAQLAPTDPPAAATPTVAPTAIPPTDPPTATAVPPTATSTATPEPTASTTATATSTPTTTPSPVPTKALATKSPATGSLATKAPTATKPPAVNVPAPVSAIPANAPLNAAVQRSFQTSQSILGELNNILAGKPGKCADLMAMYGLFAAAPVYDVRQQSTDTQTAYSLYQQGVATINDTAPKVRRICEGQGGGLIDRQEVQVVQKSAGQAVGLFGRASDLLPAVTATIPAPVAAATAKPAVSSIALSDLLLQTMERMHTAGGHLDGAQTDLNAGFCDQFKPLYQTIVTVVGLNETGRAPTWIDSYGAYKAAIGYFQNKLYRAVEVCNAGGGAIGNSEFGDMRRAVDTAAIAAARAYDRLRVENLLGQ